MWLDKFIKRKVRDYHKGKELFEQGVHAANNGDFKTAFTFYTQSIAERGDPSPYLNRARILFKRIRYWEGLQDLLVARDLDLEKDRLFIRDEIDQEIVCVSEKSGFATQALSKRHHLLRSRRLPG